MREGSGRPPSPFAGYKSVDCKSFVAGLYYPHSLITRHTVKREATTTAPSALTNQKGASPSYADLSRSEATLKTFLLVLRL